MCEQCNSYASLTSVLSVLCMYSEQACNNWSRSQNQWRVYDERVYKLFMNITASWEKESVLKKHIDTLHSVYRQVLGRSRASATLLAQQRPRDKDTPCKHWKYRPLLLVFVLFRVLTLPEKQHEWNHSSEAPFNLSYHQSSFTHKPMHRQSYRPLWYCCALFSV